MSKKRQLPPLSDVQMEIMIVIWEMGEVTVADVWRKLNKRRPLARNTVHTQIVRLEEKGWLCRKAVDGTIYFSTVTSQEETQKECIQRIINTVFRGSAVGLVLSLLQHGNMSSDEVDRIQEMIDRSRRKKS